MCPSGDGMSLNSAENKGAGCKKSSEDTVIPLSTDEAYLRDLKKTGSLRFFVVIL